LGHRGGEAGTTCRLPTLRLTPLVSVVLTDFLTDFGPWCLIFALANSAIECKVVRVNVECSWTEVPGHPVPGL
jgi:hypothetical protein